MHNNLFITYKELGETPLECLERMRIKLNIDKKVPMTYAGRLDPMAEGLLILLVGEECKKKEIYLGLSKTYEFQILIGFETDTYDLLGRIVKSKELAEKSPSLLIEQSQTISDFNTTFNFFVGTFNQKYPSFSSKTVNGKQLFQLSKDNLLPEELPSHQVTITKLECIDSISIKRNILHKEIFRRINLVYGDFIL